MRSLDSILIGVSHHITIAIGRRYQSKIAMHFVCGFPRSGTTWFSELLADYLNLPRPRHSIFPIGFASVIHTHSEYTAGIRDCFYVLRDGRDAITSLYFYLARNWRQDVVKSSHFRKVFDDQFEVENTEKYLPRFMEYIFEHPVGTKSHWGAHTTGWLQLSNGLPTDKVVIVRYERLLANPASSFCDALRCKYQHVEEELAEEAVRRQSFRRQKNRAESQQRTILRKGIVGDWKNYWNSECVQIFDHYCGDALIELGYEKDHHWLYQVR